MNISADPAEFAHLLHRQFEQLPRAAIILRMNGHLLAINNRFGAILGLDRNGFCSQLLELAQIVDGKMQTLLNDIRNASHGGRVAIRLLRAGQKEASIKLFRVWPLTVQGGRLDEVFLEEDDAQYMRHVFADLNANLRKSNEREAKARREIRKLQDRNGFLELFSQASFHDLKSPLNQIKLCAGLLVSECATKLSRDGRESLRMILHAADRLQSLIESVVTHSLADTSDLVRTEVEVRPCIEKVLAGMQKTILDNGIDIRFEGRFGAVTADETLFSRLVQNILENAVKYRSPDRQARITIVSEKDVSGHDRLVFRDNGLGFDNLHAKKIFEPFKRLHLHSEIAGSGVGLSTCKAICARHDWTISGSGEPGSGAEFVITFADLDLSRHRGPPGHH
ncbi:MAG: ATP-binding protein [Geminicoccaceae bacterium]